MPEEQLPETMNAVTAVNLALRGTEGPVYGPLTFTAPASGLTVLSGRGGSGRTALALTLAGRMASTTGEVTVLGKTKRSKIRQMVAVAGVEQIDALDRDVTIRTALSEHLNWSRWWWTVPRRASQEYYEQLCGRVFGQRDLPPLNSYVSQISALDRILIRIALALHPAGHQPIRMLVMDDLEQVRELDDRLQLVQILMELSQVIPVIVMAVNPLPPSPGVEYHLIELHTTTPAKEQQQ